MADHHYSFDADVWHRPTRDVQYGLFPEPRDKLLGRAGVSIDEIGRWRALGWISFDVRDVEYLQDGQVSEICFIRDLAHSGLGDIQINRLLSFLEPPYQYNPVRIAYSFKYGWVQLPPFPTDGERDEFIERYHSDWVESKVLSGELDLLQSTSLYLFHAVRRATAKVEEDTESE